MPLLTQPTSPSHRPRPRLWVLLGMPGLVFLLLAGLLVGLLVQSWDHPTWCWFDRLHLMFQHDRGMQAGGWNLYGSAEGTLVVCDWELPGDLPGYSWEIQWGIWPPKNPTGAAYGLGWHW